MSGRVSLNEFKKRAVVFEAPEKKPIGDGKLSYNSLAMNYNKDGKLIDFVLSPGFQFYTFGVSESRSEETNALTGFTLCLCIPDDKKGEQFMRVITEIHAAACEALIQHREALGRPRLSQAGLEELFKLPLYEPKEKKAGKKNGKKLYVKLVCFDKTRQQERKGRGKGKDAERGARPAPQRREVEPVEGVSGEAAKFDCKTHLQKILSLGMEKADTKLEDVNPLSDEMREQPGHIIPAIRFRAVFAGAKSMSLQMDLVSGIFLKKGAKEKVDLGDELESVRAEMAGLMVASSEDGAAEKESAGQHDKKAEKQNAAAPAAPGGAGPAVAAAAAGAAPAAAGRPRVPKIRADADVSDEL